MTSMTAKKLTQPEDLYEPSPLLLRLLGEDLAGDTSPSLAREFAADLLRSLKESRELGDLTPLNVTIDSWVRSLVLVNRPGFEKRYLADRIGDKIYTLEDIQARLEQLGS